MLQKKVVGVLFNIFS